ncbi:MAG: hypothetical protein ACXAB0_00605 [Candidatus Thorarchaeota archaeon]
MMTEKWKLPAPKILIILILLAFVTMMMSVPRFGFTYPDSAYYLDMVEFFSGTLSGSELVSPFSYRPMLPLIVAFLPIAPELSFSIINLVFMILIAWVIFFSSLKRNPDPLVSFITASAFIVSLLYLFYGAVVLVDPGAVFFLALAYFYIPQGNRGVKIAIFLTLGVLFKEVALVGVLTFLLYRRMKEWWLMIPPLGVYGILRFIMPSGNSGFMWAFHLDNIVLFLEGTMKTFLFGLAPFLLLVILAIFHRRRSDNTDGDINKWLMAAGIPAITYLFLGLFFAHFDVRFLWPTYLLLIPLCTEGVSELFSFLRKLLGYESVVE